MIILLFSLLIISSIHGCSGCSKSGRIPIFPHDNTENKTYSSSDNKNIPHSETISKIIDTHPPVSSEIIYGTVYNIIDGDTYDLLLEDHEIIRVRMEGIDAPEPGMPYSNLSKNYLGKLCFNKKVKVHKTGQDGDRIIGFTFLYDGTELSHEMIKAGMAWHFIKYNNDEDLMELEIEARKAKRGLWKDKNPFPPWEIRKLRRQGISTKSLFNNKKN
jgi:endonuclease YncB( thermonuclease family)